MQNKIKEYIYIYIKKYPNNKFNAIEIWEY